MNVEEIPVKNLLEVISDLKEKGFDRIISTTSIDQGDQIEVFYHLTRDK